MVLFPYVEKRKVVLKLTEDQRAMLKFDVFKGQMINKVTKFIRKNNCVIVYIPNKMTDQFGFNHCCYRESLNVGMLNRLQTSLRGKECLRRLSTI